MSDPRPSAVASASIAARLLRGVIGFGLLGCALALAARLGPIALLIVPLGLIALRGCPMCWLVGLFEAVSARRLTRTCADGRCKPPAGDGYKCTSELVH
jgi:hypothetical protein